MVLHDVIKICYSLHCQKGPSIRSRSTTLESKNNNNVIDMDAAYGYIVFCYSAFAQYNMDQFTRAKIDGYEDPASFGLFFFFFSFLFFLSIQISYYYY